MPGRTSTRGVLAGRNLASTQGALARQAAAARQQPGRSLAAASAASSSSGGRGCRLSSHSLLTSSLLTPPPPPYKYPKGVKGESIPRIPSESASVSCRCGLLCVRRYCPRCGTSGILYRVSADGDQYFEDWFSDVDLTLVDVNSSVLAIDYRQVLDLVDAATSGTSVPSPDAQAVASGTADSEFQCVAMRRGALTPVKLCEQVTYMVSRHVCSGLVLVQWYCRGLVVFLDTLTLVLSSMSG
ncbi:hypothetical protein Taro_037832 [Colocasia esculenta]|uniref:Uncharacterized protein n=1 Tax=Colocasia esculenta TaxID=4460 RepID=A0A843W1P0_COLES|nr:hypothetical protein [Colocasia esculenta]